MKRLKSFVVGKWYEAGAGFVSLVDPSTEEEIAEASSDGLDFAAVLEHARGRGGPALRELSYAERGGLLKAMSKVLRDARDELLELSRRNNGTTAGDGSFDIDGASGTLAYYASLATGLGEQPLWRDGDGVQLARSEAFWGQHLLLPRPGVAVHINAFNFPAWGFAEKAACALLAGMPVVTKPATATALVTERAIELIVEAGVLPDGALQLVCGSTGDLLERLGAYDVLAFTGSAATAEHLRRAASERGASFRFNVEADSLNAAILAPDAGEGDSFDLFVRDVTREMTQKAGQKCTAVRRVLVPEALVGRAEEALAARLEKTITGNPADESVRMGPLATAAQLADSLAGVLELSTAARIVHGTGRRSDGVGSPEGKGFFLAPTLLRAADATDGPIHQREVFAPVATLIPYDGSSAEAARIAALAGGTLVTSAYGDDADWTRELVAAVGSSTGRLYLGSASSAAEAPGSGVALPQTLHGGPGRAGDGAELGGLRGLEIYSQRIAVQGSRELVERLSATDGD